jgi:hypothetical protein
LAWQVFPAVMHAVQGPVSFGAMQSDDVPPLLEPDPEPDDEP